MRAFVKHLDYLVMNGRVQGREPTTRRRDFLIRARTEGGDEASILLTIAMAAAAFILLVVRLYMWAMPHIVGLAPVESLVRWWGGGADAQAAAESMAMMLVLIAIVFLLIPFAISLATGFSDFWLPIMAVPLVPFMIAAFVLREAIGALVWVGSAKRRQIPPRKKDRRDAYEPEGAAEPGPPDPVN